MLISWQRNQQVLVVEALEGLHNEPHQIQPRGLEKTVIQALTQLLKGDSVASRMLINELQFALGSRRSSENVAALERRPGFCLSDSRSPCAYEIGDMPMKAVRENNSRGSGRDEPCARR